MARVRDAIVIEILLIAAAILLAPPPAPTHGVAIIRASVADPQPGAPDARRSEPLLAQNAAAPRNIAGTYAGNVDRRYIGGEPQATRTYRLTMNPDMNTGKVLIYDPDGKLLSELGLVGKVTDARTFEGTTLVIDAAPRYRSDHVRLVFSPDGGSVEWYHNDGTVEGSGTLSRAAE